MNIEIENYINLIPEERKTAFCKLRQTILDNLPIGFHEEMSYGMVGFVVPKTIYPKGYHCNTSLPLPFASIASQKNSINLYHMGIYANKELLNWFVLEYAKHNKTKLDMGKSCIRFKKISEISFELIGELFQKMTVQNWIDLYEQSFVKK